MAAEQQQLGGRRSPVHSGPARPVESRAARRLPRHSLLLVFWFIGSVLTAFLVAPLLGLGLMQRAGDLVRVAGMPEVREAIAASVFAAFAAAGIAAVLGVPLAYALARTAFPGKQLVGALIDLPLAVPHTVAGIALLYVFGRQGFVGAPAGELLGLRFWGTLAGVVVAMLFVSAPYAVNAARIGFEGVDPRLEQVARTLGLGPWQVFQRVALPLAWRHVATGLTLTFARAISEFAAVAILAYYPMTAPVKIYELFLRFGVEDAAATSALLLAVSLGLFILFRYLGGGRGGLLAAGR